MTQADFIASCFWPIVIVLAVLWKAAREPATRRLIGQLAFWVGIGCLLLLLRFNAYSLVALVDMYLLCVVAGARLLWTILRTLSGRPTYLTTRKLFYSTLAFGAGLLGFGSYTLLGDFAIRPLELEGRVQRVWTEGRRGQTYFALIAGQKVKAIIPDFERLKLLVRVEVGRGSNYIYNIEYLEN